MQPATQGPLTDLGYLEHLLDAGRLQVRVPSGRVYRLRRNGRTRRERAGYTVPVKAGFRDTARLRFSADGAFAGGVNGILEAAQ